MNGWMRGLLVLAALGTTLTQDNPEYGWWSSHVPGSWVNLKIDGEIEGHPFILEQTQTLVAVDADRVVVDRKGTMTIQGRQVPADKAKDEVRRIDGNALKIQQEGDEEILLPKGPTPCHWIEGRDGRTNSRIRFWLSKEIPGGVAKGEIRPDGMTAVTRISVLSWERK